MSTQNIFQSTIDPKTPDFLKKPTSAEGVIEMPELAEADSESNDSLGAMLRRARVAKNLETKDVANRLKVSASIVQSIENDALEQLGPPVFVRNHLKRYAQLLGLSEQEVMERYRTLGIDAMPPLKVAHPIKQQTRITDLRWISYPLIAIVVIWLGWLGLERLSSHLAFSGNLSIPGIGDDKADDAITLPGQDSASSSVTDPAALSGSSSFAGGDQDTAEPLVDGDRLELPQPITEATASNSGDTSTGEALTADAADTVNADSGVADDVGDDASNDVGSEVAGINNDDTIENAENPVTESTAAGAANEDTDTASAAEAVAALDERPENFHELIMQFNDDCWVEVSDANGERLIYGIIKANNVRTINGEAPFSITLGNANAAQIKLDGETIDKSVYLTNTRGGVARFKLEPQSSSG